MCVLNHYNPIAYLLGDPSDRVLRLIIDHVLHNWAGLGPGSGQSLKVGQKQDKADRYSLAPDIKILTNLASKIWLLSKTKDMMLSIIRRFLFPM